MTKVYVISGFLGAGKTTLIKKLLKEALKGEQVVLIENEFGEIGIDGGFLKDAGVQITEMSQGCICCSLVGDFGKALNEVISTYHPDRVIIEPSGVGKLSDVMAAVKRVSEECELELNSATTVADASKCKIYMKNFGEFYDNQVENAGAIVLSRTQNVNDEKLNAALELLREKNPQARILTTPWDDLDGLKILAAMEASQDLTLELMEEAHKIAEEHEHEHHHHHHHDEDECDDPNCSCHHHHEDDDDDDEEEHEHHHHHHHDEDECDDPDCECHHHHGHHHHGHHADEVFSSVGFETPKAFTVAFISECLDALDTGKYGVVLRAKGILPCADGGWLNFDYVPGEKNIRRGSADITGKLCIIGSGIDKELLSALFNL